MKWRKKWEDDIFEFYWSNLEWEGKKKGFQWFMDQTTRIFDSWQDFIMSQRQVRTGFSQAQTLTNTNLKSSWWFGFFISSKHAVESAEHLENSTVQNRLHHEHFEKVFTGLVCPILIWCLAILNRCPWAKIMVQLVIHEKIKANFSYTFKKLITTR